MNTCLLNSGRGTGLRTWSYSWFTQVQVLISVARDLLGIRPPCSAVVTFDGPVLRRTIKNAKPDLLSTAWMSAWLATLRTAIRRSQLLCSKTSANSYQLCSDTTMRPHMARPTILLQTFFKGVSAVFNTDVARHMILPSSVPCSLKALTVPRTTAAVQRETMVRY